MTLLSGTVLEPDDTAIRMLCWHLSSELRHCFNRAVVLGYPGFLEFPREFGDVHVQMFICISIYIVLTPSVIRLITCQLTLYTNVYASC